MIKVHYGASSQCLTYKFIKNSNKEYVSELCTTETQKSTEKSSFQVRMVSENMSGLLFYFKASRRNNFTYDTGVDAFFETRQPENLNVLDRVLKPTGSPFTICLENL